MTSFHCFFKINTVFFQIFNYIIFLFLANVLIAVNKMFLNKHGTYCSIKWISSHTWRVMMRTLLSFALKWRMFLFWSCCRLTACLLFMLSKYYVIGFVFTVFLNRFCSFLTTVLKFATLLRRFSKQLVQTAKHVR